LAVLLPLLPRKADELVSKASAAAESTSESVVEVEACNPMKLSTEEAKDGVEMI